MALYKVNFPPGERSDVQGLDQLLEQGLFCEILAKQFPNSEQKSSSMMTIENLPWMIPIIGSGAVDTVGSWEINLEQLCNEIQQTVGDFGESPAGSEALATIASRFVRSLVKGRRRVEAVPAHKGRTHVEVSESAARLVLVTALLTRYCHVVRAMDPTALDRSSDEIIAAGSVRFESDDPYRLVQTIRDPLKDQLVELRSSLQGDEKFEGLVFLIDALRSELGMDSPKVSLNWARLLTEASWLKLVDQPDAYYGWSELMLKLFLVNKGRGTEVRRGDDTATIRLFTQKARYPNFTKVGDVVRDAFDGPTRYSWDTHENSAVHDAVAQVLIRQARQAAKAENLHLPRALAISTAFDLELEMALCRAGSGYQVAIPIHAHTGDGMAELVWMVGTVDPKLHSTPAEKIEAIYNPTSWVPLSARSSASLDNRIPLILRVSGCPLLNIRGECTDRIRALVQPPKSGGRQTGGQEYGFKESDPVFASHAVTIDEYLAVRLAESEIQRAYTSKLPGYQQRPEVADVGQAFAGGYKNPVYFTFFGVPFADPAVRQRLMSLLTVRWIRRATEGAEQSSQPEGPMDWNAKPVDRSVLDEPDIDTIDPGIAGPSSLSGIAINTRLDLEEASLLSRLGMSVIHGDCAELVPHVLDYAFHVCDDQGRFNPMHSTTCTVRNPL